MPCITDNSKIGRSLIKGLNLSMKWSSSSMASYSCWGCHYTFPTPNTEAKPGTSKRRFGEKKNLKPLYYLLENNYQDLSMINISRKMYSDRCNLVKQLALLLC